MSHNLTQPEEIDHVLMAMAGHDMETETPIPDGVQPSEAIRNIERNQFIRMAGFSHDIAHKKSAHGLSDP